ncbi:MAG: hypothetical protein P4L83_01280 [Nevskia sp.]|nr:hypothetical protein [Nevskia sp.]
MTGRTVYIMLALVGLVLVAIAVYTQWSTMDLERFSVRDYLARDVAFPLWWQAVTVPFFIGLGYLCVALACYRVRPAAGTLRSVLFGCLSLAVVLSFASTFLGLMAAVAVLALLFASLMSGYEHPVA